MQRLVCKQSKHKFQPRYDIIPPQDLGDFQGTVGSFARMIDAASKKIYVHDVCIKCGDVVEREQPCKK